MNTWILSPYDLIYSFLILNPFDTAPFPLEFLTSKSAVSHLYCRLWESSYVLVFNKHALKAYLVSGILSGTVGKLETAAYFGNHRYIPMT